jgi:hypothetical protein
MDTNWIERCSICSSGTEFGRPRSVTVHRRGAVEVIFVEPSGWHVHARGGCRSAVGPGSLGTDKMPSAESLVNMRTLDGRRASIGLRFAGEDLGALAAGRARHG